MSFICSFRNKNENNVRLRGVKILESGGATTRIVAYSTLPRVWRAAGVERR
jgi:hypothetical protein